MKNLYFIFSLFLLLSPLYLDAQKSKEAKANEAYQAGEYYKAIDLLKDAYQNMSDKLKKNDVLFEIADCYRLISDSKQAEIYFQKCIKKEYANPLVYYYYAEALMMNGKYNDALEQFKLYKDLVPDDPKTEVGINSCTLALDWIQHPAPYQVTEMKFFDSKQDDYAPAYAGADYSTIYFTSDREEATGNATHGATGGDFADLFQSLMDRKGKWSTPVPLGIDINTEAEEGACAFNKDYSTMYFTRCSKDAKEKRGCQVFYSQRKGEDWGKPEALKLTDDSLVAAEPAISPDGLTLYFVSDMPGGFGGKDIWMATRKSPSDEFGKPLNMGGDINTDGDEVFPYVHPDGSLYFSSNRRIGMGGLDIFIAYKNDKDQWVVENMKYPVNSSGDDFGIALEAEKERGYLSSSRDGKHGEAHIYSFFLPPLKFNVIGIVKDAKTDNIIASATVKLIGSDGTTMSTETQQDGSYKFALKSATDYIFIVSMKGYLNGKAKETTKGYSESKDFKSTILITSIDKPIVVPNIFYDYGKAELRPESMVALDNLVEVLRDNPNITIELRSHTDCRGTDEYNLDLSQRRAQSVVDYLISKNIAADRLTAKGYAASVPQVVDKKITDQYSYLKEGDVLTCDYINHLATDDQKEQAHYYNRRTEFMVIRTDYKVE